MSLQQAVGRARQCAGNDACLAKELAVDAHLQFGGSAFQSLGLLVIRRVAALAVLAQFAQRLAYAPQLRIVGMSLKSTLISKAEHLVVHARGIADAQHGNAAVYKFFRNPVHSHVALCAHQYLALAHQRLVDGLYQCGGLACARRSVHNGHILGAQHFVHCLFLRLVQVGKSHGRKRIVAEGAVRVEQVAQFGQPVAACLDDTVQALEHQAVAGLVEKQLHPQPFGILQFQQAVVVGHDDHHAVAVDIADGGREVEVFDGAVGPAGEESHRPAILKVVLNVVVGRTVNLQCQLVHRVIVALARLHRPPGVTTLHLPRQSDGLGLFAESLFLGFILQLEQQPLLHE